MATYRFKSKANGVVIEATASSIQAARQQADEASSIYMNIHDPERWQAWECWIDGECAWHYDQQGELNFGPRHN